MMSRVATSETRKEMRTVFKVSLAKEREHFKPLGSSLDRMCFVIGKLRCQFSNYRISALTICRTAASGENSFFAKTLQRSPTSLSSATLLTSSRASCAKEAADESVQTPPTSSCRIRSTKSLPGFIDARTGRPESMYERNLPGMLCVL